MTINIQRAKFLFTVLLKVLLTRKVGFDHVFSSLVKKYSLGVREARELYKLFYKLTIYYHSIRFVSVYNGFKPRVSGLVEYIYTRNFDLNRVLDDIVEVSRSVSPIMRIALLYGYPSWFVRDLYGKLPLNELENMLNSLNERKRWLRVNTVKASVEDAIECLEKSGLRVRQHKEIREMLLVENGYAKVGGNICVKSGVVIPQDISSYIATIALRYMHGDLIDTCSSPGVKLIQTLAEAKLKRTLAVDINERRIRIVPKLVKLFLGNLPNVIFILGDSRLLDYNLERAIAFVDAPCSNSGAIYADPAVKLHLSRHALKRLQLVQVALLKNSLRFAHVALFVTCSIHPAEGEEVVDRLIELSDNEIEPLQLRLPYIDRGYPGYTCSNNVYRIYPHRVDGQGFFIAAIKVRRW